ncbi:sushi, von Willebrand factor type A, EGF and pentraxin domain-containing protein 1-like [Styela clava]
MSKMDRILLYAIAALYLANFSNGITCWICHQARSNRDCIIRGHAKRCNAYEGCENEIRYSNNRISVTKRCKQMRACSNDQMQNSMLSNNRYNCAADRRNSVCRCCCNGDNCNKDQLSCLEQGLPQCRVLYLPNGYTKCFGSKSGVSLGTTCRFSCKAGYERIGAYAVTCNRRATMAEWSEQIPICRKRPACIRIFDHNLSNGFVRCNGAFGLATLGTTCVYRCNPRYFMVNAEKRKTARNFQRTVCTMEKSTLIPVWSQKPPNCIEEMCPPVNRFDYGVSSCSDFNKLGSVCNFRCYAGYDLVGEESIKCIQTSGVKNWNSPVPICKPKPCPLDTFARPLLQSECTDLNRYGSVCSVSCKKGFYMADPRTNTPVDAYTPACVLDDKGGVSWSIGPPKCHPKKCTRVRKPKYGEVKCTAKTDYMSRCSFDCTSLVHEISGEKHIVCSDDGRTGNPSGVWSSDNPTCELKSCPPIDADATDVKCNKGYVYKSTCTFSCKKGYFMIAADGITITKSKKATKTTCKLIERDVAWSSEPPKCEQKRCPDITRPDYGTMTCTEPFKLNSKCSFTCNDGFEMAGKSTVECRDWKKNKIIGKWTAPTPICKRRSCATLHYDEHTSSLTCSNDVKYESACSLRCNEGYYMRKSPVEEVIERTKTTCLFSEGGMTWSARMPACQPKTCNPIRPILNGTMKCSEELIYGAKCQFSCSRGYDLVGEKTVFCQDDGSFSPEGVWSASAPTCEPRKCSLLDVHSIKMTAHCDKGNEYTSQCNLNCLPKHFIKLRDKSVMHALNISCNLQPNDDLIWEPELRICEPISCPMINDPEMYTSCSNGNKTGSHCVFSCPIGYDLIGNATNKCLPIGEFDAAWKHPIPYCKVRTCLTLVDEEDLNMTCTRDSDYKSICSFMCHQGLGLFMTSAHGNKIIDTGVSKLRCDINKRGKMYWTGELPKCHIKYCLVKRNPKNGRVKCSNGSKYQSRCRYTCNRGYKRVGASGITCDEGKPHSPQGAWSKKAPTCKKMAG